jgi:hypothetical protein
MQEIKKLSQEIDDVQEYKIIRRPVLLGLFLYIVHEVYKNI